MHEANFSRFDAKLEITVSEYGKNVVSRYVHEGSAVCACFLDASKAFDLVSHEILFSRLLDRNFPVQLIRLLMSWYKDQHMCVRWDGSF